MREKGLCRPGDQGPPPALLAATKAPPLPLNLVRFLQAGLCRVGLQQRLTRRKCSIRPARITGNTYWGKVPVPLQGWWWCSSWSRVACHGRQRRFLFNTILHTLLTAPSALPSPILALFLVLVSVTSLLGPAQALTRQAMSEML